MAKKKSYSKQSSRETFYFKKGQQALDVAKLGKAVSYFEKIPKDSPHYGRACKEKGAALLRFGHLSEALTALQAAHRALPKDGAILVDGADVARLMGHLDAAESTYAEARRLGENSYQLAFGAASLFVAQQRWLRAAESWMKLTDTYPDKVKVLHNLGKAWHELGETDRAMELWANALKIEDTTATRMALAIDAPHAKMCSHESVKKWRTELAEQLLLQENAGSVGVNPLNRGRQRLKIGYVSAFFHRPNWMKPVWALLNHQNREQFEVHLFADGPPEAISESGGYQSYPRDIIHDTRNLNNAQLRALMREHAIDIVVDLNGYSCTSRLGLWVSRPAPLSVGWFNFYATSGMPGIEYLIGDEVVVRSSEEKYYTEKIRRLKQSYVAFQVGYDTPDISSPERHRPFTYGCLGSGYKITPAVRNAWIQLLNTTTGTRLLVRNRVLDQEEHKQWFAKFFTDQGVASERLHLLGSAEHTKFLQTYDQIDLALDTFPYNGGTTTMESLWQGVPVICFTGDRWVSRTSATLMHAAELDEFIGSDVDDYIKIAAAYSTPEKQQRLHSLRNQMRTRLEQSSVCDGDGLAREFERLIIELWENSDNRVAHGN